MRSRLRAALSALALALGSGVAACASQSVETEWERIDSASYVSEDRAFTLELPLGWMRSGTVLAREPAGVHAISFNAGPVLAGEDALAVDASAPELAQALGEQLAAQPGVTVIDCRGVTLDGLPGFRAHFTQELPPDDSGALLQSEHLLYSAIDGEMLYAFALEAPAGADFARDLAAFEGLVASFRRLPPRP
jgi:hypothetical protein